MPRGRKKNQSLGPAQREQQLLELLYKNGPSTAKQLEEQLDHKLNNSTIRTILRILEEKQLVTHSRISREFVYAPTHSRLQAADNLFHKLVDTFFSGSSSDAMATFIDRESRNLDAKELEELMDQLQQLKEQKSSQ
ncbi:MAG: BlaI/MecI/CopY family transcriptional regulator [Marinicella sp.]|nr:BlaI/MecI/CopY family transcriptional regulator [Xanthomonadales bacterium]